MDLAFFLFTTVIICIAVITTSVSLVVWLMTHRRDCLVAAAGFVFYAIEVSLIFFDEYVGAKPGWAFEFLDESLRHPLETCILGIAVVGCLWIWTLHRSHQKITLRRTLAFVVPFAVGCFLLVPRESSAGIIQQYCYWMLRDLGVAFCLVYVGWRYRFRATKSEQLDLARSKTFYKVALVLVSCIIVEDTFMILFYRPVDSGGILASLFWHLSGRNISENLFMVACATQLLVRYRQTLTVYARHPRTEDVDEGTLAVPLSDLTARLALFSDSHGLSKRETEVVELVIRGFDARGIANELIVAPGTVKAHMSRIYHKVGVGNREGLIEEFWRS